MFGVVSEGVAGDDDAFCIVEGHRVAAPTARERGLAPVTAEEVVELAGLGVGRRRDEGRHAHARGDDGRPDRGLHGWSLLVDALGG